MSEVEEAVEAEPGLSEEQQQMMRACAYDSYDMLVMCDEFLNTVSGGGAGGGKRGGGELCVSFCLGWWGGSSVSSVWGSDFASACHFSFHKKWNILNKYLMGIV